MRIRLNKDKFTAIDGAFLMLKENNDSTAALQVIKSSLEDCFDCEFSIKVIARPDNGNLFVMSVYPEMSVIDKIISAVSSDKGTDTIAKLWESNKKWTIEIDQKLLRGDIIDCTDKELTAILLHEVGHIICSNSIPSKISLILKYEVVKTKMSNKMMLHDQIFRLILSLPILDSCISDNKKDLTSIKEEIKADKFAKKMGYSNELYSALTKLMNSPQYKNLSSQADKMSEDTKFALKTLEDIHARRAKLAKTALLTVRNECTSDYLREAIDTFLESVFEDSPTSKSIHSGRKLEIMQERADKLISEGCYQEFFLFGPKKMKRIEPMDLDYIDVKIQNMKTESDKMMIVTYIHGKLDMVNYYIDILSNPTIAPKYLIPHTLQELYGIKKRLLTLRDVAIRTKLNNGSHYGNGLHVQWPDGYYG